MVQQDHVFAVIGLSALTFSASPYLTSNGIPVVGAAFDSSEWLSPKSSNMFSVIGNLDFTKVYTTDRRFLKSQGVTNVGTSGTRPRRARPRPPGPRRPRPRSQGIKAGYVNDSFPFGGTNVAPVALAMKSAGVNGINVDTEPNTVFALATALEQEGVHLKAPVLPTGYGGDLINSGPAAIQAAQGDDFLSDFEPIEMHTPATAATAERVGHLRRRPHRSDLRRVPRLPLDPRASSRAQGRGVQPDAELADHVALPHHRLRRGGSLGRSPDGRLEQAAHGQRECYWMTRLSGIDFHLISGSDPDLWDDDPGQAASRRGWRVVGRSGPAARRPGRAPRPGPGWDATGEGEPVIDFERLGRWMDDRGLPGSGTRSSTASCPAARRTRSTRCDGGRRSV